MSTPQHHPLISVTELRSRLPSSATRVIDARFDLSDPQAGERTFMQSALPGARYLHLDRDLSDHTKPARCGRHPLPDASMLAEKLAALDVMPAHDIVIYDAGNAAMAAARAWWLLRLLGYPRVAVLDGGLAAWKEDGCECEAGRMNFEPSAQSSQAMRYDTAQWIDTASLQTSMSQGRLRLLDARAPERFRGEAEPLDTKAGHIPGAVNRPFCDNLENGRFKSVERLRYEFLALMDEALPTEVVLSCGSGVTACHNLLAMEIAGLHGARLYPSSWSGWIASNP